MPSNYGLPDSLEWACIKHTTWDSSRLVSHCQRDVRINPSEQSCYTCSSMLGPTRIVSAWRYQVMTEWEIPYTIRKEWE